MTAINEPNSSDSSSPKTLWQRLKRPPWRTILLFPGMAIILVLAYRTWSPGMQVHDGRYDLRTNGIWLQHSWLGEDRWFQQNRKDKTKFRDAQNMRKLADLLASHGIKYVFPHLCPCQSNGKIASVDDPQTELFLDHFDHFTVIPWIGGVLNVQCFLDSPQWRRNFVASTTELLRTHPRLAGVQINIEPLPTGNNDFLLLLDDLRQSIPPGKLLSVAAYPPPTWWQPSSRVHWEESYFRQVARRVNQLAPMMYDTGIRLPKVYQYLMSQWTSEVLNWSENAQVLLGVPAYDDSDVGYHLPQVENLENALSGIQAGLSRYQKLPSNYAGIALYCEWEMDQQEWSDLENDFEKHTPLPGSRSNL